MERWDVTQDGIDHTLVVDDDVVVEGPSAWRATWAQVAQVAFPTGFSVRLVVDGGERELTFRTGAEQREFRRLAEAAGVRVVELPVAEPVTSPDPRPRVQPGRGPSIESWLIAGVGLVIVGGLLLVVASAAEDNDGGAAIGLIAGFVVSTIGSVVLGIGVVAMGVKLGMDAHARR